jgi:hypothetical protein
VCAFPSFEQLAQLSRPCSKTALEAVKGECIAALSQQGGIKAGLQLHRAAP